MDNKICSKLFLNFMIILCVLMCLSCVCAHDVVDSNNPTKIIEHQDIKIDKNPVKNVTNDDMNDFTVDKNSFREILSVEGSISESVNGERLLSQNSSHVEIGEVNDVNQTPGSFDDLQVEIDNAADGSILFLTRDYNGQVDSRIQLDKNLIIDGQNHTIDCLNEKGCSAFYSSNGDITLKNLRIINANNDYSENGGAIYITDDAKYTICNCIFENNHADNKGGAIYSEGSLCIVNSTFLSNDATSGGAVYVQRGLEIQNAVFVQNSANEDGGAIFTEREANINGCYFEFNRANGVQSRVCYGGAIRSEDYLKISNSTFRNNYAQNKAGAVYAYAVSFNGSNSFEDNVAGDFGGAIYTYIFDGDVKNVKFINNTAKNKDGGAICIDTETKVTFSQCIFVNNHAGRNAGVLYMDSTRSHLSLKNNFFNGNSAGSKGQSVFDYGYYDSVENNCWCGKNPSSKNDVLIAAHMSGPCDYKIDTNPLEMDLILNKTECEVKDRVSGLCYFKNANGSKFDEDLFDLSSVTFYPNFVLRCSNIVINSNSVSVDFTPRYVGTYSIPVSFYDYQKCSEKLEAIKNTDAPSMAQ